MVEQAKLTYSPLGKALEKQMKKKVYALKPLNPFNKIDELKEIDDGDELILWYGWPTKGI